MRTNLILSLVLVSFLVSLTSSSNSYLGTQTTAAPVCSDNAGIVDYTSVDVKAANTGTVTAYEKVSYYFDGANKDNIEIRASYSSDSSKIVLTAMDRALATVGAAKELTRVNGETIHTLIGRLLITRQVDPSSTPANQVKFNAYHFGSTTLTALPISLTNVGTAPFTGAQLTVVGVDDVTVNTIVDIYVFLSATTSGIYKVSATILSGAQSTAIAASTAKGTLANFPTGVDTIYGGAKFIILSSDGTAWKQDGSNAFTAHTAANLAGATATYTVNSYLLIKNVVAIVSSKISTAGAVTYAVGNVPSTSIALSSVTTAYRSFTDDIRNVFVIGGVTASTVAWLSVEDAGTVIAASIAATTNGLFFNAIAVALANHRAFILNTGSITVVQAATGATDIQLIRQITSIPAGATTLTATQDFSFTTKCNLMTYLPKRFTCFASTFNCVLTSKAFVGNSVLQTETVGTL